MFLCFLPLGHLYYSFLFLFFFSEELNNGLSEDVPSETKESTSCDATEHKEIKLDGASLSSTGE